MTGTHPARYIVPLPVRTIISRARLIARLNEGLTTRLIQVSAPAGWGKTTLLADWLQHLDTAFLPTNLPLRRAWVTYDPSDNQPETLVRDILLALRQAIPDFAEAQWTALETGHPVDVTHALEDILTAITAAPYHIVFVADDFHHIINQQALDAISRLLQYLPPNFCVAHAGRQQPSIALAQLRARGHLTELRGPELAFSQSEANLLLRNLAGDKATKTQCRDLQARTEGWATGLVLAGRGLAEADDPSAYARNFAAHVDHYVADYLTEQVIVLEPDHTQRVLMETAILSELTAEHCAAILGDARSGAYQAMLEDLEQRNIFIMPLDRYRRRYRYHQIFGDLLRDRLEQSTLPEVRNNLHRRAAAHLAQTGEIREALRHYLAGDAALTAARLIEQQLANVQETESFIALADWLALLPRELIETRPGLLIAEAWVLNWQYRRDRIPPKITQAEALLDGWKPAEEDLAAEYWRGHIAAMHSVNSHFKLTPAERLEAADTALALVPQQSWLYAFVINSKLLRLQELGRMDEAQRVFKAVSDQAGPHPTPFLTRLYLSQVALYRREAAPSLLLQASTRYLQLAEACAMPESIAWAHYGIAQAYYALNDLDRAAMHFSAVLNSAPERQLEAAMISAFPLVRIYIERGELERADELVAKVRALTERVGGSGLAEEANALALFPTIARGDKSAARRWLAIPISGLETIHSYRMPIIRAQICLAAGTDADLQKMVEELHRILEQADAAHQVQMQIEGNTLLARTLWRRGFRVRALDALEEALSFAAPRGHIRSFTERNAEVGTMLYELVRLDRHAEAAREMLAHVMRAAEARQPVQSLVDPLTERELEILELLAEGLTNKEIGAHRKISPFTVRNHITHIYAKLGVRNREEAIKSARLLRLIETNGSG
jgi:LuxR family maltose regulon positive regulatory protein